jgi:hypothetical protein
MADHRDRKAMDFEHDLIHRAIRDGDFRARLLSNPTRIVQDELRKLNGRLGTRVRMHVVEETPLDVYIVLPPRGQAAGSYDPYNIGRDVGR